MQNRGPLPDRPAIAPWYRLAPDDGRIHLEHGGSVVTLEGRAATLLLPALLERLDGTRTVAELVAELGPAAELPVRKALELLHAQGVLCGDAVDATAVRDTAAEAAKYVAASARHLTLSGVRLGLGAVAVDVVGGGDTAHEIGRLLEEAGVVDVARAALDGSSGAEGSRFLIAAVDAHEVAELGSLNARRVANGGAWLPVIPHDGRHATVGPLYVPSSTACHACLGLRRGACSGYERDFDLIESTPPCAATPSFLTTIAAGIAALLTVRWLAASDPTLPGRFYTLATGSVLQLELHHLLRVPRCPVCGHVGAAPTPWFAEAGRES